MRNDTLLTIESLTGLPELPQAVLDAYKERKLVVFVGAGISRLMGCRGWEDMANDLVKAVCSSGTADQIINSKLDSKAKITIAKRYAEKGHREKEFWAVFKKAIKPPRRKSEKEDIYDTIAKLNIITFDHDIYYHCRSRNSEDAPYTYDEMLKAPYGYPKAGRYNQVGRAHFYFADTRKGAETEVKRHLRKNEVLQTVKIKPKRKIELLDLSGTLQRGTTFLKMIRFPLKDMDNQMPKEYLLPCYVADCCKLIGIEGIKYYGSKEYNNYVSWEDGYFLDAGMCG